MPATTLRRAPWSIIVAVRGRQPETAAGCRAFADLRGEIIDGANLVCLAEAEILTRLMPRRKCSSSTRPSGCRWSPRSAPRAVVDVAYVVFEAGRLIRRLAGFTAVARGTLGFFRLARDVLPISRLPASIAVGDFRAADRRPRLAARLSAKLVKAWSTA